MPERPPVADHSFYTARWTEEDRGAQAVGMALVAISYQLDRVIELLEAAVGAGKDES